MLGPLDHLVYRPEGSGWAPYEATMMRASSEQRSVVLRWMRRRVRSGPGWVRDPRSGQRPDLRAAARRRPRRRADGRQRRDRRRRPESGRSPARGPRDARLRARRTGDPRSRRGSRRTVPPIPVWVVGYLIPLEGAARWGLPGAALGAAAFLAGQLLPEFGRAAASSAMKTSAPVIAFRAGMALVVGAVAGSFASLLAPSGRGGRTARPRCRGRGGSGRSRGGEGRAGPWGGRGLPCGGDRRTRHGPTGADPAAHRGARSPRRWDATRSASSCETVDPRVRWGSSRTASTATLATSAGTDCSRHRRRWRPPPWKERR